jgi:uncharacterized protein YeaO (DUF488 family)
MNLIIDENWSLRDVEWYLDKFEGQYRSEMEQRKNHIEQLKALLERKKQEQALSLKPQR